MYFGTPAQEAIIEYNKEKDPKKKAMTGSPATKVDVKPEVEYDK